ncbi:ABC transporter ATP-binding protein [Paenarthrobacter sp. NPDC058040]|uniref:ABC transporter ATP-binding protein n=1 Tax=unclassified Paenarthrobacter TaxID=2634190 RepID=UPI0036DA6746
MDRSDAILEVQNGSKSISGHRNLLDGISLTVEPGDSVALVGKSGSGKSTLLSILGLLDDFDGGSYHLLGRDTSTLRQRGRDVLRGSAIGFVFQRFSLIPHLSALENVMAPLRHDSGTSEREKRFRAHRNLELVEMDQLVQRLPRTLSGGEQQRVAIARALIRSPRLILADEPTGSLDAETGETVMNQLLGLGTHEGRGLVVVTHDNEIACRTSRTVELHRGKLIGQPHRKQLVGPFLTTSGTTCSG